MSYMSAIPAYGRDYTSKKAVQADWDAGKDFMLQPSGRYINKPQADQERITVALRYARLTKQHIIKPGG